MSVSISEQRASEVNVSNGFTNFFIQSTKFHQDNKIYFNDFQPLPLVRQKSSLLIIPDQAYFNAIIYIVLNKLNRFDFLFLIHKNNNYEKKNI